jgi:hypothetical protein
MRTTIYRIQNDDDPLDYQYPMALSLAQLRDADEPEVWPVASRLMVGESFTIGGGAAVQFSVKRIR